MRRADMESRRVQEIHLVVDEVIVIIVMPEVIAAIFFVINKMALNAHQKAAISTVAVLPEAQRVLARRVIQVRPPGVNRQHAGTGEGLSKHRR